MNVTGLDFGASRLRIAVECDGKPSMGKRPFIDIPVNIIDSSQQGKNINECKIVSLKQILDFDTTVQVPPDKMNSLDYLAKMLRQVTVNYQPSTGVNYILALPPCFSQRQRSAVKTATRKAGLLRLRIVDDSMAVLLANKDSFKESKGIVVYSWGASTFSVSFYRQSEGSFKIVSQDGKRDFGGDNIDSKILTELYSEISNIVGQTLFSRDNNLLLSLTKHARCAKLELADGKNVQVRLSEIFDGNTPAAIREKTITIQCSFYRRILSKMIDETIELMEKMLERANSATPDTVLLSGHMSQLPEIREALEKKFKVEFKTANENDVAIGAVLYGIILSEAGSFNEEQKDEVKPSGKESPSTQETKTASEPTQPGQQQLSSWADNFVPLLDKAQIQYEGGRLYEAIDTFEKLFTELGKFSSDLYFKAASKHETTGNLAKAVKILEIANLHNPSNRVIATEFARLCYQQAGRERAHSRVRAAIKLLDQGIKAVESLPKGIEQYVKLVARLTHFKGCLCFTLGELTEAKKLVSLSIKLDPEQQDYKDNLEQISKKAKKRIRIPLSKKHSRRKRRCR